MISLHQDRSRRLDASTFLLCCRGRTTPDRDSNFILIEQRVRDDMLNWFDNNQHTDDNLND